MENNKQNQNICVVYKITNIINNKLYVGSTYEYHKRQKRHKRDLKNQVHHSLYLQNSVNKYGIENFVFEILEEVFEKTNEYLLSREQYYIDNLNPEYNICPIAGNCLGRKFSDEQLLRAKEYHKKPILQYTITGIFIKEWDSTKTAAEAIGVSQPTIGYACRGKCNHGCGYIWRFKKGENIELDISSTINFSFNTRKRKKVIQKNINGSIVKLWNSAIEACEECGFVNSKVYSALSGSQKTACGFIWKYADAA
nr:hypothetical protein [uncultured archaeon]